MQTLEHLIDLEKHRFILMFNLSGKTSLNYIRILNKLLKTSCIQIVNQSAKKHRYATSEHFTEFKEHRYITFECSSNQQKHRYTSFEHLINLKKHCYSPILNQSAKHRQTSLEHLINSKKTSLFFNIQPICKNIV